MISAAEKFQGKEKRRARRISHHYVIHFKQLKPPVHTDEWGTSTVRDISKTGISFFTSRHYEPGAELEIKITNPLAQKEDTCWATVVRSHPSEKMKGYHEVAVRIDKVQEPSAAFDKTIEFFIKKEDKKRNRM